MTYEMSVIEVPETRMISIRGRHRVEDMATFVPSSFETLFNHLAKLRVVPAGEPFVLYHAFGPGRVDCDVCVPIGAPIPLDQGIELHVLPATVCVRTLHVGPYEALSGAYQALTEWIEDHGYRSAGPVRERYLNAPGETTTTAELRTEIDIPVESAVAGAPLTEPVGSAG